LETAHCEKTDLYGVACRKQQAKTSSSRIVSAFTALSCCRAAPGFCSAQSWKSEHSGFAKGGAVLRISGQGFVSGGEYYCRFRELSGPRAVWSLADAIRPYDAAIYRIAEFRTE